MADETSAPLTNNACGPESEGNRLWPAGDDVAVGEPIDAILLGLAGIGFDFPSGIERIAEDENGRVFVRRLKRIRGRAFGDDADRPRILPRVPERRFQEGGPRNSQTRSGERSWCEILVLVGRWPRT